MNYQITKEIRIHHKADGWFYQFTFYQFTDDGEGCIQIDYYKVNGITETKQGKSFHIPKDCIQHFIDALEQLKNE
jgi:hypothetical protein